MIPETQELFFSGAVESPFSKETWVRRRRRMRDNRYSESQMTASTWSPETLAGGTGASTIHIHNNGLNLRAERYWLDIRGDVYYSE